MNSLKFKIIHINIAPGRGNIHVNNLSFDLFENTNLSVSKNVSGSMR